MKNSFFSAIILTTLMSVSAFAGMTGTWVGSGTVVDYYGVKSPCDEILYDIHQSESVFTLKYGHVFCGNQTTVRPYALRIVGHYLIYNGQRVGTIADGSIHLDFINANRIRVIADMTTEGTKMVYKEKGINYYGQRVWFLETELTKE